jgi:putative membrane-bound dehydrogenase-like protein
MLLPLLLALVAHVPAAPPLRVFLRGGPKTHGPNQHEHEKWLVEWQTLLASRGAVVEGALRFPTEAELARTDVLVLYAADGGSIHGEERKNLEQYLARGGGIVALHDAVVSDDPQWWSGVLGGAWENGKAKWHEGTTDLYFTDRDHPVSAGISNFRFEDELYTDLDMRPEARVLVRGFQSVFDASPQAWVLEKDMYRAFVAIQGHQWSSFSHPAWRTLLLRGIAWAGKRDAELLTVKEERDELRYPPGGPLAPEKAAAAIEVHPDFDLSLVAAEPLVVKPISIDWDAHGRMWVAETPGYPEKERFSGVPAHDEISILSDTDGDGRMDKKKVFFHGLDLVTSLVFHRDGVIVSQSPDILWLRDTDGDDVADKTEVLYSGFGFGDTHAVISNLRWGMDGWIYATQGYSGNDSRHVVNAAGKDFGHIGNGLFRFKPDGSAIEMVSSYGSNTWGCDFDGEGELFFTMANGAHLRHVVVPERVFEGGRMGRVESWADCPDHDKVVPLLTHTDPAYAQIDFVGGFTAASGCMLYTGGAWPKEWNDAHFVAEPTVHLVHHDVLHAEGVTFKATKAREAEFIAGKDLWFRPVHMREGPDGAMYVLDFYNQAVVHNDTRGPEHGPTNFAKRPDRDHMHGRIWRVQHKRAQKLPRLDLARMDEPQLAGALGSPNGWTRTTAERLIVERGKPVDLREARRASSEEGRIAAQWTSARMEGSAATVRSELGGGMTEPLVRTDMRIASEFRSEDADLELRMLAALNSGNARTRLLALVALGDGPVGTATVDSVVGAWPSYDDPWTRNAALRVAAKSSARAFALGPRDLGIELARRAARRRDSAGCAAIVIALAAAQDPAAEVLDVLARDLPAEASPELSPGLRKAFVALLVDRSIDVESAALRLAQRWDKQGSLAAETARLADHMGQVLADARVELPARTAALATLLSIPERRAAALEQAGALLEPGASLADSLALVEVLARVEDPAAARVLARAYPALRQAAGRDLREARRARQLVRRAARRGRGTARRRARSRRPEAAPPAQLARRRGRRARAEAARRRRDGLGRDQRADREAPARGRPARRRGARQAGLHRELRRLPHGQRRGRQDRARHQRHGRARRGGAAALDPRPQPHGRGGLRRVEPDDQGRPALRRRARARERRLGAAALERRREGGRARGDRVAQEQREIAHARGPGEDRRRGPARRDRLPRAGHRGLPRAAAGRALLAQLARRHLRPPARERGAQAEALRHQPRLRRALRGARPRAHAERQQRDRDEGRHGARLGLQADRPDARRGAGRLQRAAGARARRHRRLGLSLPPREVRDPQVDLEVRGRHEREGRAAQRRRVRRLDRAQRRARLGLRRGLPGRRLLGPGALPLALAEGGEARRLDRARELRQPLRADDRGADGRAAGHQARHARETRAAHACAARRAAGRRRL